MQKLDKKIFPRPINLQTPYLAYRLSVERHLFGDFLIFLGIVGGGNPGCTFPSFASNFFAYSFLVVFMTFLVYLIHLFSIFFKDASN